jgi:hypothetical protein
MRRLLLPLLLTAGLAACGSDEASPSAGKDATLASLTVTVDDDGAKGSGAPRTLEVECAEPTDSRACGAAAGISPADVRPPSADTACTMIFGGPEEATIKGTIRGAEIDAAFTRTDGCEIARWEKVQALLDEVP